MILISERTYSVIIKDDIKNISKLTATNIYSDISIKLTKPIFVSLTMANDKFVEDWLEQEKQNPDSPQLQLKIKNYLNGLKEKYGYNSVFLVSDYTKDYYHYKGINKVLSESNQHDQWYYDFLSSKQTYALDVDTDEVNNNKLSIFINCRIEDEQGNLLGVTGVGLEIDKVQELLAEYKKDFKLDAILFDKNGVIQVHSDTNLIEKKNLFADAFLAKNKDKIINNKDSISVIEYKNNGSGGYAISKYIEDMDWYLLVEKDTSILKKSFQAIVLKDLLIFILVMAMVLVIISKLIKKYDMNLRRIATTDALTGLPNRRSFDTSLVRMLQKLDDGKQVMVFVLDIDNFKGINDAFGHLSGDKLICQVGKIVHTCIKERGEVFRWGGDEFTGYIYGNWEEIEENINKVFDMIRNSTETSKFNATISMGTTLLKKDDTIEALLKRADKALYQSKEEGKNRYKII